MKAPTPNPDNSEPTGKVEGVPRLPHERDESTNPSSEAPTDIMRIAEADAKSPKVPTDRSEETDAAYATLRGDTPGSERDVGPAD